LHTLRWLWHANRTRLPFHVVIADGEVHPAIERVFSDPLAFPYLSYEYHRYEDRSLQDYYCKIADALGKVRTPYVMMMDNDDFPMPFGVGKAMSFLDSAPDYVCAGGGIPGFTLGLGVKDLPNVTGPLNRIWYRYIPNEWYRCRDIDSSSASKRLLEEIRNPLSVHYSVYRTCERNTIANEIVAINPCLRLCEMFAAMRTMTLGKVKSDPSYLIYFRQRGSSQCIGYSRDLIDDILYSKLAEDFKLMAAMVSEEAAQADACKPDWIKDQVYDAYADHLRMLSANTMLRYRFPHLFTLKQVLRGLPKPELPAILQRKLDLERMRKRLASDGADEECIVAHRSEIGTIVTTLEGKDFFRFVTRKAPELLAYLRS
jgi:glycosyltransferase domain-containing protein